MPLRKCVTFLGRDIRINELIVCLTFGVWEVSESNAWVKCAWMTLQLGMGKSKHELVVHR